MATSDTQGLWEKESPLYCSSEWHLARAKSGWAGLIYSHALRVSRESKNYFCSIPQMATYLKKDERTIRSAFRELEKMGFFERIRHNAGGAVNYYPVAHKEWAERHPNQCLEKVTMPWDDTDALGRSLYAVCGGQVKFFFPNVLKGLRKVGFTDEEIVRELQLFLAEKFEQEMQQKTGWHGVIKRFREYLAMKRVCYKEHMLPASGLQSASFPQTPLSSDVGAVDT